MSRTYRRNPDWRNKIQLEYWYDQGFPYCDVRVRGLSKEDHVRVLMAKHRAIGVSCSLRDDMDVMGKARGYGEIGRDPEYKRITHKLVRNKAKRLIRKEIKAFYNED